MSNIASYVVRYDSGFAPNPFYGYCTLATCKPEIRRVMGVGDWIVGCGSNAKGVRLGGRLVYAMRVTEVMTFDAYSTSNQFQAKIPYRSGSRKQSCGDNIYYRNDSTQGWQQRDSFHSQHDGASNPKHIARDTGVNRVLISDHFKYFGGTGPEIPAHLQDSNGRQLCKTGIGWARFDDSVLLEKFVGWFDGLDGCGYSGPPEEWLRLRGRK